VLHKIRDLVRSTVPFRLRIDEARYKFSFADLAEEDLSSFATFPPAAAIGLFTYHSRRCKQPPHPYPAAPLDHYCIVYAGKGVSPALCHGTRHGAAPYAVIFISIPRHLLTFYNLQVRLQDLLDVGLIIERQEGLMNIQHVPEAWVGFRKVQKNCKKDDCFMSQSE